MRIVDEDNRQTVTLEPWSWESAPDAAEAIDNQWMIIRCWVVMPEKSWFFAEPCLYLEEARELGDWLLSASKGRIEIRAQEETTDYSEHHILLSSLMFTESLIGFSVMSHDSAHTVVRIAFSQEGAPPASDASAVDLKIGNSRLAALADEWRQEVDSLLSRRWMYPITQERLGPQDGSGGLRFVPRRELAELLALLENPAFRGVLLLGEPGTGKTTLLAMAAEELARQGRAVFPVSLGGMRYPGDLGTGVLNAVAASAYGGAADAERTLRSSQGAPQLDEAAAILDRATAWLPSPVLLVDALDESVYPGRMASAVEQLSLQLNGWDLVVATRSDAASEIRRFSRFGVLELGGLAGEDVAFVLRRPGRWLPADIISRITESTGGNPVLLQAAARYLQSSDSAGGETGGGSSLENALDWLVNQALEASSDPLRLAELFEELALAGGRARIAALASRVRAAEDEVMRLLSAPRPRALLVLDGSAKTAAFFHDTLWEVILSRRVLKSRFRLADLKFGAEEAERDGYLDESYVERPGAEAILGEERSIVVGDRGSGKSAIFQKLTATDVCPGPKRIRTCPVTDTGDLLRRIVDKDDKAWLDTDTLRAAWLVVVASRVASALPATASKQLRRDASGISAALGFPAEPAGIARRSFRAAVRLLGGTTLKFSVGPADLEVKLPSGSSARPGKASVDVGAFLRETNRLLGESGQRFMVMFDRIDETFKYDRAKQQAVVQALLQAEGEVSQLGSIGLVVFLRTDLFEVYDIQEKTKLVSRTLTLDWAEEEWVQVLVRRVLANEPLRRLASRLHIAGGPADGTVDPQAALQVLFPQQIEGRPADRWLIESLRNGNGDVSPRLAILLLNLTRDHADRPQEMVSTLPLFSADEVAEAMTRLSDLYFSEVVNDFKVAPSFILNCRAGRIETFALEEVTSLFDETEGKISDQIRLLERLGFLERVVQERHAVRQSLFRIPRLYTRCWDHA